MYSIEKLEKAISKLKTELYNLNGLIKHMEEEGIEEWDEFEYWRLCKSRKDTTGRLQRLSRQLEEAKKRDNQ